MLPGTSGAEPTRNPRHSAALGVPLPLNSAPCPAGGVQLLRKAPLRVHVSINQTKSKSDEAADAEGDPTPACHPNRLSCTPSAKAEGRTPPPLPPAPRPTPSRARSREGKGFSRSEGLVLPHSSRDAAERGRGRRLEGFVGMVGSSLGSGSRPGGVRARRRTARRAGEGKERGGVCVTVKRNRIHGNFLPDA